MYFDKLDLHPEVRKALCKKARIQGMIDEITIKGKLLEIRVKKAKKQKDPSELPLFHTKITGYIRELEQLKKSKAKTDALFDKVCKKYT